MKPFATPGGTRSFFTAYVDISHGSLGDTDLLASRAGFGCYRVTPHIPGHADAMKMALGSGINLIDASTNYADGDAERLVGRVLSEMIRSGELNRDQVIMVSKAGYLRGSTHKRRRKRATRSRPFPERVNVDDGLTHGIEPTFLKDQLQQSLERLKLDTIDFYLLHNPECFLEWAHNEAVDLENARVEFYQRVERAFAFLETMVTEGYIRYYGVSANTLPALPDAPDFVSLTTLWECAMAVSADHHFRMVQMPFNLLETGAATTPNQPDGTHTLEKAKALGLAVLANRPLNAFTDKHHLRLTDIPITRTVSTDEIIRAVNRANKSEAGLSAKLMSALEFPVPLQNRIREQLAVGKILKHHWRHFVTYERWRHMRQSHIMPRIQGVMAFLAPHRKMHAALAEWMDAYAMNLEAALNAVESIYAAPAAKQARRIGKAVAAADTHWATATPLSQKAINALRTTEGVSTVLVGMRRTAYVTDVVEALKHPLPQTPKTTSWQRLQGILDEILFINH